MALFVFHNAKANPQVQMELKAILNSQNNIEVEKQSRKIKYNSYFLISDIVTKLQ